MTLAELLEKATPGPWTFRDATTVSSRDGTEPWFNFDALRGGVERRNDARLIALAPELAQLALDMGDALRGLCRGGALRCEFLSSQELCDVCALVVRLDGIANKDKTA